MGANGLALKLRVVSCFLLAAFSGGLLMSVPLIPTQASDDPGGPALDEKDCRTLMMLYRALRDEGVAPDEVPASAVGNAILARPGCGETQGALQEVRRGSGVNPWDERAPGGFSADGTEQ